MVATPPSSPEHYASPGDSGLSDAALKRPVLEENSGSAKRNRLTPDIKQEKHRIPPTSPPGEAFAHQFLRGYEDAGRTFMSANVLRLASCRSRKWGLACELPAGWYVIDDSLAPGQAQPHFDLSVVPRCGWKVTGPQMKTFNPEVPVQIRYANPKEGCTTGYGEMRAAVYTLCRKDATGTVVEGDVKLIHVYVGRGSRNRKAVRRHRNRRKTDPATACGKSPNVTDDFPSSHCRGSTPPLQPLTHRGDFQVRAECSAIQPPVHLLHPPSRQPEQQQNTSVWDSVAPVKNATHMDVYNKIVSTLKEACMPDAARLVQQVIAEHLTAVST